MPAQQDIGLTAYGAYIPRLRLKRAAIANANAWFNPGLRAQAKGVRAMANWDEDSVTMAVEAGRDCLGGAERSNVDALFFGSTTMPFSDRQNAGIIAAALTLSSDLNVADVAGSQRAGTQALALALSAIGAGRVREALVVAGEHRKTRAGAVQEMQFGDAAAALTVGTKNIIARFVSSHSVVADFVDHFRDADSDFDYSWEERWIRDEGLSKIVPAAIDKALKSAGLAGADIAHFIFPSVFRGMSATIAKKCGMAETAVRDDLQAECGEAGAAHPLLMLAHVLESANPGDKILLASFGQGCDVLVFEATDALKKLPKRNGVSGALKNHREEDNYMKFLAFNGLIDLELGMRAEVYPKTALTVLYRKSDLIMGFVGGKCSKCGTVQIPRTRICVNPNCKAADTQEPFNMAEEKGKILSWSADFLSYSIDPPSHYGMVTFEEGGRLMMDFTDCDQGTVDAGQDVRLVFRIKDFDRMRGFRKYFWKAVPQVKAG